MIVTLLVGYVVVSNEVNVTAARTPARPVDVQWARLRLRSWLMLTLVAHLFAECNLIVEKGTIESSATFVQVKGTRLGFLNLPTAAGICPVVYTVLAVRIAFSRVPFDPDVSAFSVLIVPVKGCVGIRGIGFSVVMLTVH